MSKILDPDHSQGFEGPNLGSNWSQRLSVQDKSGHWKVKSLTRYLTHLFFQTSEGLRFLGFHSTIKTQYCVNTQIGFLITLTKEQLNHSY